METAIYSYDNERVRQIERIEFDIFGNDEIKKYSVLGDTPGIEFPELYDNYDPKKGGLIDPRLGTIGNDTNCASCGLNTTFCVGHFGHIDLAEYVFNIGYFQLTNKVASCICLRCSKILIHNNEKLITEIKMKPPKDRLQAIRAAVKNVTHCQKANYGCGNPVPKIKMDCKKNSGSISIIAETDIESIKDDLNTDSKKKLKQILTPDILHDIFKNISDDDCILLGFDPKRSRPEDMIHKVFPVPPIQMRPSTRGDFMGGSTIEDCLTHKLADIVKMNLRIIKSKENQNDNKYGSDNIHLLQFHCATYIDNDTICSPIEQKKGKPFKSVTDRLKTKEGRIRGNLMGKRGDFTARTVITSDPTIENNKLGVPVKIAMNLTFPEIVTVHNKSHLEKLVRNGRDKYPGANFIFQNANLIIGKKISPVDLRYRKNIELQIGDIVERHLQNGDPVLLNRQPTLHKQSMMSHIIKIIDDPTLLTFRLSVAITTPYNADKLSLSATGSVKSV
jgi:DNA-directed RNA polymerase II subunit RPB1